MCDFATSPLARKAVVGEFALRTHLLVAFLIFPASHLSASQQSSERAAKNSLNSTVKRNSFDSRRE